MRPKLNIPSARPAPRSAAARAGDDYGVTDGPDWRAIDWAAHRRQIDIGGVPVTYVDIGEADDHRPIVFVHGLSGQWQNWLENIPRFAAERRVVAMDLPGFGCTPMPDEEITIEYYGGLVAELCDRLDLAPAVLVGNSMGGFISAEASLRRPEVVERLLLLSAAGISQSTVSRAPVLAAARVIGLVTSQSEAQRRMTAARPGTRHAALNFVVRHPTRLRPDVAFEGLLKGAGKPGFLAALEACLTYDFRDRLDDLTAPTLIVWGRDDMVIPVKDADGYEELIPGARKIVLDDTGHVPMIERPRRFNDILQEFVEYEAPAADSSDAAPDTETRLSA